jgi:hypothetical protein
MQKQKKSAWRWFGLGLVSDANREARIIHKAGYLPPITTKEERDDHFDLCLPRRDCSNCILMPKSYAFFTESPKPS